MKRFLRVSLMVMIAVLAISAGMVVAQDATPEATPETAAPAAAVYLGIGFEAADTGITVTALDPRGPAAEAGLEVGDVITALGGEAVTADNVVTLLSGYAPGDELAVTVDRDGETQDITVTLVERDQRGTMPRFEQNQRPLLGVRLAENEAGAEITEVVAGSAAEDAGLQVGDIITAINGETVDSPQAAQAAIGTLAVGDTVTITVTRDGETQDIEATLGAAQPDNRRMPETPRDFVLPMHPGLFEYLPEENAYAVGELPEDSAYYEAGLRTGDRITAVNGESVADMLFDLHAERTVTITVDRDGETLDIDVPGTIVLEMLMGGMPGMGGMMQMPLNARLGLMFVMLDEETAAELEVEPTAGAYVRAVEPDSPAAEAGIEEGDIITAVDGETLNADLNLRDAIADNNPGDEVTLTVLRDGEEQELTVTLGEPQPGFGFDHPVIPRPDRPRA